VYSGLGREIPTLLVQETTYTYIMEFDLTDEQRIIKQAVSEIAADYDDEYW
jgi:hypothetical protein